MLRVTKPGGVVAAREGDLETEVMWPPLPGLLKFHHEYVICDAVEYITSYYTYLISIASKSSSSQPAADAKMPVDSCFPGRCEPVRKGNRSRRASALGPTPSLKIESFGVSVFV
jgi:hypothetical protein